MKNQVIRWGILGTGWMAEHFIRDFSKAADCKISALGSRSWEKAEVFRQKMNLQGVKVYGTYREVCTDPEVDVVYVATPHNYHKDNTLLGLEAGKPVLCEKPLAVNSREVAAMVECARRKGLFLMEAMWTGFLPVVVKAKQLVDEGALGEVYRIKTDLSYNLEWNPQNRFYNPNLAGGALLDLGVYTLFLIQYLFGDKPEALEAFAHIGSTGVDENTVAILRYPGGRLAQTSCAVRFQTASLAVIEGTKGWIHIPNFCYASTAAVTISGQAPYTIDAPHSYHHQVDEVNHCLRAGLKESSVVPLNLSEQVMANMDAIRQKIGLKYPFEI